MIQRNFHLLLQKSIFLAIVLGFILFAVAVRAESPDPKQILEVSTHQMVTQLNARREEIKTNPKVVNQLAEQYLLPHIDFIAASKWVLGKHWRRANREQKLEFVRQFRSLLLRFYSSGLAEYLNKNTITESMFEFQPLRMNPGAKRATVHLKVHSPGGKTVPVKYEMHLTRNGWKVYDVSVEGISLAITYRNSFSSVIHQSGIDGLIANLAKKNSKLQDNQKITIN